MSLESVFANPPPLVGAESSSREEDFDKSDERATLDLEDGELEDGELDDEEDGGPPPASASASASAPSLSRESSKEDHKESHSGHRSGEDESKRGGDGDRRRNSRDQNRKRRRDQRQERDRRDRGPKNDRGNTDRGSSSHRKRKKGRYHDYDNMGDDDMPSTSWSGGAGGGGAGGGGGGASYERGPYDSPGRSPNNRSEHFSRDSERHKPPNLDQRSPPGPYDSPAQSDDEYGPPPVLDRLDSGGENYGGGSMFSMLGDEYMDANVAANEQEEMFTKAQPGSSYGNRKRREKSDKYFEKKRRQESERQEREQRGGKGRDRGQPRQKRDCKYFLEGTCRQGEKCPFFHDQERAPKPRRQLELCKYFLNSICTKGSDCIYMHGDYPCKYYHRGGCKEGDKCQFSHQPLNEVTQGIIDKIEEEERAEREGRSSRDSEQRPRDRERKYSHDDSSDHDHRQQPTDRGADSYNRADNEDDNKFKDTDYSRPNEDYWSSKEEYRPNEEFGASESFSSSRPKEDFYEDYDDKRAGGKDNFRSPQKKPSILGDGPSHLYKKSGRDQHNKRGGPPIQNTDPKKIPSLLDMKLAPPPPRPTGPPPNMLPPPGPGMPLSPAHRPMRPGFYGDMSNSPIRGPIPGPGILGRPPLLPPPPMGPMGPLVPPPGLLPPPPPGIPPPGVPPTSQAAEMFMNMMVQNLQQQMNTQKTEEGSDSPVDPTNDPEFLQRLAPKQMEVLKRLQQGDGDSPSTTANAPDNSHEDQNWYSSDEETGNDTTDNPDSSADPQFNMLTNLRKASSLPTPQGSGNGVRDPRMTPSSSSTSSSSFVGDPRARSDPRSASSTPGRPDPRSFKPPLLVKPALKKQKSDNEVFINGSMTISGGVPYFLYKITTDTRPCLPVGMDLENPPYEGDPRLKKYHKPGPVLTDVTSPTMLEVAKVDPRRTSLDSSPTVDPRSRNKSMTIAIPPKPEPLEVILPDLKHSQSQSQSQPQSRVPSADSLPKLLDPRYARQLSIGEKKDGELKSPPPGSANKPAFSHRNDPRFKKKIKTSDSAPLVSPGSGSEPDKQSGDENEEIKLESMETEEHLLEEAPIKSPQAEEDMDNDAGDVDEDMLDTDNAENEEDLLPKVEEAPSVYRPPPKATRMEFVSPLGNLDDTLPEDQYGAYGRPQKRNNDNNKRDSNLSNKGTANSSHAARNSPPAVMGDEAASRGSNSPNTSVDYPGPPSMLANNMDTSKEDASPQNVRDMFNSIDPTASPFC